MAKDYKKLEGTLIRLRAALLPLVDDKTYQDLTELVEVISEVRFADQSIKDGTNILDVEERLINSLFHGRGA